MFIQLDIEIQLITNDLSIIQFWASKKNPLKLNIKQNNKIYFFSKRYPSQTFTHILTHMLILCTYFQQKIPILTKQCWCHSTQVWLLVGQYRSGHTNWQVWSLQIISVRDQSWELIVVCWQDSILNWTYVGDTFFCSSLRKCKYGHPKDFNYA